MKVKSHLFINTKIFNVHLQEKTVLYSNSASNIEIYNIINKYNQQFLF
jgi:hypothetical protein